MAYGVLLAAQCCPGRQDGHAVLGMLLTAVSSAQASGNAEPSVQHGLTSLRKLQVGLASQALPHRS